MHVTTVHRGVQGSGEIAVEVEQACWETQRRKMPVRNGQSKKLWRTNFVGKGIRQSFAEESL